MTTDDTAPETVNHARVRLKHTIAALACIAAPETLDSRSDSDLVAGCLRDIELLIDAVRVETRIAPVPVGEKPALDDADPKQRCPFCGGSNSKSCTCWAREIVRGEKPASQRIEDEGIAVRGIEDDPFPCARCAGTKKVIVIKADTGPHLHGPCPDCFTGEKEPLMHPEHFTLLVAAEAIANDFKDDSLHGPDYVSVSRTGFDLLMGVLQIKRFKNCRHRVAFGDHCSDCEAMKE